MSTKLLSYQHIERPKESSKIDPKTYLHTNNIKSAIKTAANEVFKAEQAFNKTNKKVTNLLDNRSALLQGEAAYRGLFDDNLNYGTHSTQDIALGNDAVRNLVKIITKYDNNKPFIAAINAKIRENIMKGKIPSGRDFYINKLSEAFLPPFATFPDDTKNKKSIVNDIARGIITGNTNLKAIIARESIFYVLFRDTQTKYKETVGTLAQATKGRLNTLNGQLKTLQDTMRRYNQLNPSFPMVIPGMMSATGGQSGYYAVLSDIQIASSNQINATNSAEANVLLREVAQQLMQELTNISNTLQSQSDTAKIDLYGIMSKESVTLIDKYRILKPSGKTMADKYGSLVGATFKDNNLTLSLSRINKHVTGLSTMIKLLSDEGSRKIMNIQAANNDKNNAVEELSKLIRRVFAAIDSAFGLPSD